MMKRKSVFIRSAAIMLVLIMLVSPVSAFAQGEITLDVTEHTVFQNISVDTIIAAFDKSPSNCKTAYDGNYYVIYGKVASVKSNYKELTLAPMNSYSSTRITCTSSSVMNTLKSLRVGDYIKVYGQVDVSTTFSNSASVSIKGLENTTSNTVHDSVYSLITGVSMDRHSMITRRIANTPVVYAVPSSWLKVESALPNVSGYQYKLNELTGEGVAESVFIFYVDSSYLEYPSDITKTKKVRDAIVTDILCNKNLKMYSSMLPMFDRDVTISTKKTTDYASFVYYTGRYKEQNLNRYNHRVEFAFIENNDSSGVTVLLYVYNNAEHADDIMFVMRTLK